MSNKSGRGSFNGATPYDFGGDWKPSELELERRLARRRKNQRNALIAALSSFLVLGTLTLIVVTSKYNTKDSTSSLLNCIVLIFRFF